MFIFVDISYNGLCIKLFLISCMVIQHVPCAAVILDSSRFVVSKFH
jgi:hypothetical protein